MNIEFEKGDLVYVKNATVNDKVPLIAVSEYVGEGDFVYKLPNGEVSRSHFDKIRTQHHGYVYVNSDISELARYKT